jgi:hypothetical protein
MNNTVSKNSKSSINLTSRLGFYSQQDKRIFSNTTMVSFIMLIGLIFIGYAFYTYYYTATTNNVQAASSYYGQDINLYEPLFKEQVNTVEDCIKMCEQDVICDGITYNNNTQICTGTKDGQIRNESSDYSAWVKPKGEKPIISVDFNKAILVGFTKSARVIDKLRIPNPYMLGNFCWSFNLVIYDFYKNYGSWRHIFHKGTDIPTGTILGYQSWENLIKDYPSQQIGVWLAPFTNNLRIAITTTSLANRTYGSYNDAFVQKCDSAGNCYISDMPSGKWADTSKLGDGSTPNTQLETNIEFFDQDLQNIPINTQISVVINFNNTIAEVYFNGKIVKVAQLDGTPKNDKSNLYVLNEKTANCELSNLLFFPDSAKLADVQAIMKIAPPKTA